MLDTWRNLSPAWRAGIVSGVVIAVVGVALGGYFALRRPGDVSNPDAAFEAPTEVEKVSRAVDWPLFGYDDERTKFLPTKRVGPPFKRIWQYDAKVLVEFAPIIVDGRLYAIDNAGVFFSLDGKTGKVLWKRRYGSLNASSPAYADGNLYAVTLEPAQAFAVEARTGKLVWQRALPDRSESSPVVRDGRMYFGSEDGTFYALRARDGKPVWEAQLEAEVKAAPALHDGVLYIGDYAGEMYAIRARDGKIVWRASDLGVGFGRSGRFYSTPAVAFGRVFAGNVDGRVYSFELESGEIAWTHSAGDYVYSGIAAADTRRTKPAVYFGSHDTSFYALDARTGAEIWQEAPGGQVSGPATVVGTTAYVSTFAGGSTVGFNVRTGKRVFKYDEGEYGPVVSDGERLYVVGDSTITMLEPAPRKGKHRRPDGTKGIVGAKPRKVKG